VKPVVQSSEAASDIKAAVRYYFDEAGAEVAGVFIAAIERAVQQIGEWPGSGSSRLAETLDLPGLRTVVPARFPYVIFYFDLSDRVDVWRVLHVRRDITAILGDHQADDPSSRSA